jgi:hypothetical protein
MTKHPFIFRIADRYAYPIDFLLARRFAGAW